MRYSKRLSKKAVWLVGLLVVVLSAGIVAITQIAGAAPNPAGNNGTIKVDREPFDDAPGNEPHVGCTFQVDFYGFDEGDLNAEVTFTAHPPTGERQVLLTDTVFIGQDDNSGGGSEAGLDASKTYTLDLSGITPHPNQGVHVELTIHADGSQGADTKHKVFWVTGCEAPPTTTTTTVGQTTTTVGETTTTVGETTTTVGETTTSTPQSTISPTTSTVGETTTTAGETTTTAGETTTTAGETTTTVGETTTTVGETTTSTPQSTISPTTSTVGETTTTAGEETTTTAGETTTTAAGETTTTAAGQTTTTAAGGRQPTTSGQGPSGNQLVASKRVGLPSTGANALPMIATGLLLALVGVGALLVSRRLRAR